VLTHAGYAKHAQVLCSLGVIGDGAGGQMEWFEAVDGHCERVDAAFWSEPINVVTNAAFLIAALWAWRRPDLPVMGRVLNAVMLAWMIEVYHRHMLAGKRAKR